MKVSNYSGPNPPLTRPVKDRWQVGENLYDDTSDMLAVGEALDFQPARYEYISRERPPRALTLRLKNAAKFAAGAAALAAGSMASVCILGNLVAPIAESATRYDMFTSPDALGFLVVGLALTAGCAAVAGAVGLVAGPLESRGTVEGSLQHLEGRTYFYPNGALYSRVDLDAFSQAAVPPADGEGRREYGEQWWNHHDNLLYRSFTDERPDLD